MENKYFTPEITDIRVGYEAEFNLAGFGKEGWKFVKFKGVDEAVRCYHEQGFYRTPYLTIEQIEAEGWVYTGKSIDIWFEKEGSFEVGSWTSYKIRIHYGLHDKRLSIDAIDQGTEQRLFQGECKDINTFRYICKLLNI